MRIKKLSAGVLVATMVFTGVPVNFTGEMFGNVTAARADEEGSEVSVVASGDCSLSKSDSVSWSYDSEGTLTISGTGNMKSYSGTSYPYYTYMENIKKVVIGEGVTNISSNAFSDCTNLTSVSIADTVTNIGGGSFSGCTSLTSVTIPDSVTILNSSTFNGCTSLSSVTLSNTLEEIGSSAFSGCSSLTNITLPYSLTNIDNNSFSKSGITSISIPASVTSVDNRAFYKCDDLVTMTVDVDNETYDSRDNCNSIIVTETNELLEGCKATVIPSSVTSIGIAAFYGCAGLTEITIPDSVTTIGKQAFFECSGLTSISIPSTVTSIEESTFYKCSGLENVSIPASVTTIGKSAFYACTSLTSIVIPNSVTDIGQSAFYDCKALTSITVPASVTTIGLSAFYNSNKVTVYGCENSYIETYLSKSAGKVVFVNRHQLDLVEAKAATCVAQGNLQYYKCSSCGRLFEDTEAATELTGEGVITAIDSTNHAGDTQVRDAKDAACTEKGYTGDTYCLDCGEMIESGEDTDELGHAPAEAVKENEIAPTCTENGSHDEVVYCSRCSEELSRTPVTDEATGHVWDKKVTVSATTTEDGYTENACSVCELADESTKVVISHPAKITLSATSFTYTGKTLRPTVKVVAADGTVISADNYKVIYPDSSINVGTYNVTVLFTGSYEGSVTKTYKISQAANSITNKTSSYSKTSATGKQYISIGAKAKSGKITYTSSDKKIKISAAGKITIPANYSGKITITLKAGNSNYKAVTKKITLTVKPGKDKLTSVVNAGKNSMTIKWVRFAYANGYEIYYSLNRNFKSTKKLVVSNGSTVSKSVSRLSKNKTYYVKVRAYKNAGKSRMYGAFSDVKKVKISR